MITSASLRLACSVCFGDPSSPMTKGAEAGVLVLAGFIVVVLIAFASLFLYWMRRAKALERALAAAQEVTPLPRPVVAELRDEDRPAVSP